MRGRGAVYWFSWAASTGLVLAGVALLVSSWWRPKTSAAPEPRPAEKREPAAPKKAFFVKLLTPADAAAMSGDEAAAFARREAESYRRVFQANGAWTMRRVLARGFEFDSDLSLTYSREGDLYTSRLAVTRKGEPVVTYRVSGNQEKVTRVEMAQGKRQGFQEINLSSEVPIAIGDLQVRDAAGLYAAAAAGRVRVLGDLDTLNASRMRVYEALFEPSPEAGEREKAPALRVAGNGASALVYLDAASLLPRTLRIFDAGSRLVRVYSGLEYDTSGPEPSLLRAQVTNVQTDSVTFLRREAYAEQGGAAGAAGEERSGAARAAGADR